MYESAPATLMLATHCACCARPLVDAQSVETGVGPVCRRKYLVADKVSPEARTEGNKLIHTIAKLQKGAKVTQAVARLKELGFVEVVKRINKRINKRKPVVQLSYQHGRLYMKANVPEQLWNVWLISMRNIPGMRYEGRGLGNSFPIDQKRPVYGLLQRFFSGRQAIGPKGEFII
jgi:hypothetical protein